MDIVILLLNLIIVLGFSNQGKAYTIFTWYLGMIFMYSNGIEILIELNIMNLFLSHFYFIGQFVLLSFFYLTILKEAFQKRIVKIGLVIGDC